MRHRVFKTEVGKRIGPTPVVAGVGGKQGSLLYILDAKTKDKWLVDGGATVSVVPASPEIKNKGPTGAQLSAANGTPIETYGRCFYTITLANREFKYEFIIADVQHRIIGSDFLSAFYLAPNHRDGTLIDLETFDTLPASFADESSTPMYHIQADSRFYQLLEQFPTITTPAFTIKQPQHGVRHHIPTDGPPVQAKARKLAPDRLAVAKAEIEKLVDLGICKRGKSEWASPLMVAPKPGGGWRVCGDYRRLNSVTTDDKYPVRTLTDFTADLHGKKVFSKIDLLKGYHQIPVAEEDVGKTGVITPFGLFIFPRTPFGLKNAGQDFQRLMDEILGDIPRVFVYIDDILVASDNLDQHYDDLKTVFTILEQHGMVINRAKCVLAVPSVEFLGYRVDKDGITPLPERVLDIKKTPPPTTVKELQSFLGMINYYRRFLPQAAHHLTPLFDLLRGKPKTIAWTASHQTAFDAIKDALAAAALLHHPRPNAPLALTTDASNFAIGAVLEQRGKDGWEPLAFYSAKLQDHQRQWPPYDRELLAAFKATRHFRPMIEGRAFTLFTDHQSLIPSMTKKSEPHTARQAYQLSCISEYTTDIRYVEGKANVVADALSRPPQTAEIDYGISNIFSHDFDLYSDDIEEEQENSASTTSNIHDSAAAEQLNNAIPIPNTLDSVSAEQKCNSCSCSNSTRATQPTQQNRDSSAATNSSVSAESTKEQEFRHFVNAIGPIGLDLAKMAADQPLDRDYVRISGDARSGLNFKRIEMNGQQLIVDISNGPARPFVPFNWRRTVFDIIHGLGHPGVERTRQTISDKFYWPTMREDSSRWARECQQCQLAKINRHTTPPIGEFTVPERRFSHLNLDLVGPLPLSNGFKYLLTAVDRFTRWPIAVPLRDISSESVIDAFAHGWVSTFGVPASITTDRGSQFSSSLWSQLMKTWSIKTHSTTPYHPAANGLVERFHRRLKEALIALSNQEPLNWFWHLPCALLSIRTTLKPDLGASPADLVFGEGLTVPGSIIPTPPSNDDNAQRRRTLDHLRLEVARLQPTSTSAHRSPRIHVPDSLANASHVFVLRGGHQPSLSSPYMGPFRVVSRSQDSYRIAMPGRGVDSVNIARLKPAVVAEDDDVDGEHPVTPPTPPPPGRRPGIRTRVPDATDRVTRRRVRFEDASTASSSSIPTVNESVDPQSSIPTPRLATDAQFVDSDDENIVVVEEEVIEPIRPVEPPPPAPAARQQPTFFTRPHQRTFSRQRPASSYGNVLQLILERHCDDGDANPSSTAP